MDDEQTNAANKFARDKLGGEVDEAAGATGLRILRPTDEDDGPPSLPWVALPGRGRTVSDLSLDLGSILETAEIFRREEIVVTIDARTGALRMMTPERFITWISRVAVVYESRMVGTGELAEERKIPKTMPQTTAKAVLASDECFLRIRSLARVNIVRQPIMREDGKIELLPEGYDEPSEIFTLSSSVGIDESMTLEKAKSLIDSYYGEFPWSDTDPETGKSRSKAVAVTAALSLFGLGLQKVEAARMGVITRANSQGGGKSLIAQMAITPTFGLPKTTPRAREEELRKNLDTAALQGASYLFFDNLKGHLESPLLEGFMTSPVWGGRVMGTQKSFEAKKSTVLLVTGNNLTVSPDLQRRMLQCDLFVEEFDLQERRVARDLNPVELNRDEIRAEFLSALWAFVKAWDQAGRPSATKKGEAFHIASFKEWSRIFGGIVENAGFGNPLVPPSSDQQADQNSIHQRKLIGVLAEPLEASSPRYEYKFQDIADIMHYHELFSWKMKGKVRTRDNGDESFECDASTRSILGQMLTNELSGRRFTMPDGTRVKFFKDGDGRTTRYCLDLLPPVV